MEKNADEKREVAKSVICFLEKNEVPFRKDYDKEKEKIRSKSRLQGSSQNVTKVNR